MLVAARSPRSTKAAAHFVAARTAVGSLTACIERVFTDSQGRRYDAPVCTGHQETLDQARDLPRNGVRTMPCGGYALTPGGVLGDSLSEF